MGDPGRRAVHAAFRSIPQPYLRRSAPRHGRTALAPDNTAISVDEEEVSPDTPEGAGFPNGNNLLSDVEFVRDLCVRDLVTTVWGYGEDPSLVQAGLACKALGWDLARLCGSSSPVGYRDRTCGSSLGAQRYRSRGHYSRAGRCQQPDSRRKQHARGMTRELVRRAKLPSSPKRHPRPPSTSTGSTPQTPTRWTN